MNPIYVLCVLVAGAALVQADCTKEEGTCVEVQRPKEVVKIPFDCFRCRAEAIAQRVKDKDCFVPECNKDGSFVTKQYDPVKNFSYCYDPWGDIYHKKEGKVINCKKGRPTKPPKLCPFKLNKAKKGKLPFRPRCQKNGNFAPRQCYKIGKVEHCWCSQAMGKIYPGTFWRVGKDKPVNCGRHRRTKYNCKKDGFKRHPFDCKRYISCSPGRIFTCICGDGRAWDNKLGVCNWQENVKCPRKPKAQDPEEPSDKFPM